MHKPPEAVKLHDVVVGGGGIFVVFAAEDRSQNALARVLEVRR